MNFRTESFDFPQNEQRRCLSCDMAMTQREAHARWVAGRGGIPRVNWRILPGQEIDDWLPALSFRAERRRRAPLSFRAKRRRRSTVSFRAERRRREVEEPAPP